MTNRDDEEHHSEDNYERFVGSFNSIEQIMRARLGSVGHLPFWQLSKQFFAKEPWQTGAGDLLSFANLRNAMVHTNSVDHTQRICTPTNSAVDQIVAIEGRLAHPRRAKHLFLRDVTIVGRMQTLARVLDLVRKKDWSQFPVCDGAQFHGLLTAHSIAKWLATYAADGHSMIDLANIRVSDLLPEEEGVIRHLFKGTESTVEEIAYEFASLPDLEAVLITESGEMSTNLLGIATTWDLRKIQGY